MISTGRLVKVNLSNSKRKTHSQKKVADVVGDEDGNPQIGEVEAVAQKDERQRQNMMGHQLSEVLPRLLQLQQQYDRLMCPIARLQEVVSLEGRVVRPMREQLVHARRAKIPHGRAAHDVQTERAEDAEVDGREHLLRITTLPRG